MKITSNMVVSMDYTLTDSEGNILDTSEGRGPLEYIHGKRHIIPGLEKELEGKTVGDKLKVSVKPEEGYGVRDESMVVSVPKSNFGSNVDDLRLGMMVQMQSSSGVFVMSVTEIGTDNVTLDGNHPLAGKQLNFDVNVLEIRAATEEELQKGLRGGGCGDGCDCSHEGSCGEDEGGGCGCGGH